MKFFRDRKRRLEAENRSDSVHRKLIKAFGTSRGLIEFGLFGIIAALVLELPSFLTLSGAYAQYQISADLLSFIATLASGTLEFLSEKWPEVILALVIMRWFRNYRTAVENELNVLSHLFHASKRPNDWDKVTGKNLIQILSVVMVLTFVSMSAFLAFLPILFVIVLAMWVQDVLGNSTLQKNLRSHLANPDYQLEKDHRDFEYYERYQQIAKEYWLEKPQLERIVVLVFMTVLGLLMSISEQLFGLKIHNSFPIAVLVFNIIGNEVTMRTWREERDASIAELKRDQED